MEDGKLSEIGKNKCAETSDGCEQKAAADSCHRQKQANAAMKADYINPR
jgi:hypothetical protein